MDRRASTRAATAGMMVLTMVSCAPKNRTFGATGGAASSSSTASTSAGSGGAAGAGGASSSSMPCVPESDTGFCTRLAKSCESVTANDNCGAPRTVPNCGSCDATQACVTNVCRTPVCSDLSFSSVGVPIDTINDSASQDIPAAVTPDGATILFQRGAPCDAYTLFIADETAPSSGSYTPLPVDAIPAMDVTHEQQVTLTADGLSLIAPNTAHSAFLKATRTGSGQATFGTPSNVDFATLSAPAGGTLNSPVISADGLAFYYVAFDAAGGRTIYESVRASTSVPFTAGTAMPDPVQIYQFVTGVSSDRMALFLEDGNYAMAVLTRTSVLQPYANPNAPNAPPALPGFRIRALTDCKTLVGTCTPGGCVNEDTCTYAAQ